MDGHFTAFNESGWPVQQPQTVLFIGPADDSREMYSEYLHWSGFTVLYANTTDDGLKRAAEADVIVTEIRVRGSFDGVELVGRVRHTDATSRTPVIVLTSSPFQAERERALAAGSELFLQTPCLPEVLLGEIKRLLMLGRVPAPHPAVVRTARRPKFAARRDRRWTQNN